MIVRNTIKRLKALWWGEIIDGTPEQKKYAGEVEEYYRRGGR